MNIRIVLVDDQELVRTGFRMVLDAQPDMTVVGEASDGLAAVEFARTHTGQHKERVRDGRGNDRNTELPYAAGRIVRRDERTPL